MTGWERYVQDEAGFLDAPSRGWVQQLNEHYQGETTAHPRLLVSIQRKLGNTDVQGSVSDAFAAFGVTEAERDNVVLLLHFIDETAFYLEGGAALVPFTPEKRLDMPFFRYVTAKEERGPQQAFRGLLVEIISAINLRYGIAAAPVFQPPIEEEVSEMEKNRLAERLAALLLLSVGAFIAWGGWLAFLISLSVGTDLLFQMRVDAWQYERDTNDHQEDPHDKE